MGCASSKQMKGGVADVYRPPPSSFAVFDINAIEEPWLKLEQQLAPPQYDDEKQTRNPSAVAVPTAVLEKLEAVTEAPRSWDEVSKALETHLKSPAAVAGETEPPTSAAKPPEKATHPPPQRSLSVHTVEELEAKTRSDKQKPAQKLRKTESAAGAESKNGLPPVQTKPDTGAGFRPLKENIFLVRDREQREKEGNKGVKWDPLSEFPEKCPPGGENVVVIYTTSLRGVRKTYEDCLRVREIMEQQGVVFDERDVALDAGVRNELRELLGDGATAEEVAPPRVFVKGRYVGGAAEVGEMNERGKLGRVMRWARVDRVGEEGRVTCHGCGGARWLPCLHCGGSSKLRSDEGPGWERCTVCNENGLVRCPLCFTSSNV